MLKKLILSGFSQLHKVLKKLILSGFAQLYKVLKPFILSGSIQLYKVLNKLILSGFAQLHKVLQSPSFVANDMNVSSSTIRRKTFRKGNVLLILIDMC